ncbi:MAG: 2-oxo acid dehydrogenase subunit E2 [Elusimicrobia bacterium]|nr:2-oxo acid dehydrogenase subunit E2 [Elusimicrobiota bacterium]
MANEPLLVTVPKENVNDETVRLAAWRAAEGSRVDAGGVVAEIETSKAIVEVLSPVSGHVRHAAKEGEVLAVGGPLCYITAGPDDPMPFAGRPRAEERLFDAAAGTRFSKKARELALKHDVVAVFTGRGLVRESDVVAYLRKAGKADAVCGRARAQTHLKGLSVTREDLPQRKLVEIRSLSQGQNAGLSSLVSVPCALAGFKKALGRSPELSATPLAKVLFEAGRLLRKYPILNGYFDQGQACLYDEVHLGFVIDADKGLKVPVVRDADKKDLEDIAREMQDLMLAYEEDSLSVEALCNGTFTVTDLSAEGVVFFHPLINQHQAAILAVAAPAGDSFDLILGFDHRLTEGRAAARFLKDLRASLLASR